jgi:hypothetical protein
MKVALHDADKTNFPNLALMKLSTWHKEKGRDVCWYDALWSHSYDKVYSSKVFTFTKTEKLHGNIIYGGTGYDSRGLSTKLAHRDWDRCRPDYNLYGRGVYHGFSLGFLTRGCPNNCSWCIVPTKEGKIRAYMDIEDFLEHDKAVLLDNNVLAHAHGIGQIEKIIRLGIKVDFNQGLDARLIDNALSKLLAKVKWLSPIRLACDTKSQMNDVQRAVTLLRWHNATPMRYSVYVLVKEIECAMERVRFIKGMNLDPFAQPYIDEKTKPTDEQKDFARWVNHRAIFRSVPWEKYRSRINNRQENQADKFYSGPYVAHKKVCGP